MPSGGYAAPLMQEIKGAANNLAMLQQLGAERDDS
ncbi:MAG: hypothetical protein QOE61_1837 [Micromonosporaceae bacterium]|jgi:hypothetical protein|nr:hypothetical protein [Micromonosporaceae bacterium]